eukprot:CAMPEP_0177377058 /NCGR_PEP_ID=MMETSP0368-20130122/45569_1 /TAXON_ID=447022 ORGANISM="Scrippsiella hangoei-like, Strain SHHI-4" /NCGR_SAMPLE_ID=MMETSP0368 /ASSEMBLY_ACC=CAM_ASM_000363 /LENGTH=87 /DNA_ID=CAMNT_0018840857 /DNA_START=230 /DNA_END=493 /DNA_ORIENTATION=+
MPKLSPSGAASARAAATPAEAIAFKHQAKSAARTKASHISSTICGVTAASTRSPRSALHSVLAAKGQGITGGRQGGPALAPFTSVPL